MNTDNKIDIEKCFEQLEKASLYESNENTHSKILAYFFKTKQDFLKQILEKAEIHTKNYNVDVETEKDERKDILIKNNDFVLVIENKYKDRNRKDQLEKYEKYINQQYQQPIKKFIYLRPFMHNINAEYPNWIPMTYKDILNILNNIKADKDIDRYKKIIENKIYGTQDLCIECLTKILKIDNTKLHIENSRGDINGYSIEYYLNNGYKSFLQIEQGSPIEQKKNDTKLTINLTVNTNEKTIKDIELFKKLDSINTNINKFENKDYEWYEEEICKNEDLSPEIVQDKIKNSIIINIIKELGII